MDLPSEWLCSIHLFVLYAGSLASMLTGFWIDGQTFLVSLLLVRGYCTGVGSLGRVAFDIDHQLFVEFFAPRVFSSSFPSFSPTFKVSVALWIFTS
ncbi:hypothetical protein BDV32DRAFT_126132 [Aspergillus pseudonomiae]|uniref:Uncharacterized protein n=1 Tax=Aspergillus pseudonomiae TaxID=1506151 RepID=A0A5N6HUW6_9EURO|nr:uncharacterized protein BDV37DRAFT_120988 [Aspergillus pseudonomiae]KAB8258282.1 hypothetical protein BDV32DRAFT_126132 [Aspergillus pseudonomiae]KAE8403963.1 hypothetical protein BDV37DRAFT_120988 [Aspergillus pseudonomiae]